MRIERAEGSSGASGNGIQDSAIDPLRRVATTSRTNEDLAERYVWLEAMINHVPDYIYAKDREGRFIFANAAVVTNNGFEHFDEMIGLKDSDLHGWEAATEIHEIERRVMNSGEADLGFEERALKGNCDRWLMMSRVPLRNRDGEIVGVVGASRDITARKAAERMLKSQTCILQAIVSGKPVGEFFQELCEQLETGSPGSRAAILTMATTEEWRIAACPASSALPTSISQGPHGTLVDVLRGVIGDKGAFRCIDIIGGSGDILGCLLVWYPEDQLTSEYLEFFEAAARMAGIAIDRSRDEEKILYLAEHDALTGLPNRDRLERSLDRMVAQADIEGGTLGVAFLDLDNFKHVNDSLGHRVGDLLLSETAVRIKRALGAYGIVGRIGGDEFVIVLEGDESYEARMERVRAAICLPFTVDGVELQTACSIGIAAFPDHGHSSAELMAAADLAMYRVKREGRDGVRKFTKCMSVAAREKVRMTKELRTAIENDELVVHYQPQKDLRTGKVCGVEALVRWQHEGRLVMPGEFIPLAEETGLICALGEFVMTKACAQVRAWQAAGVEPFKVGVNMSARQFQDPGMTRKVADILSAADLDPRWLEVEITESMIMCDVADSVRKMSELTALGISLALDDFGTGYSSLSTLKSFPLSRLKIDRSFVKGIPADENDMAIASAILSMAKKLGIQTMAEGVENAEQEHFLRDAGCCQMQGYYLARPLPPSELREFVTNYQELPSL
ncbi:EAL domain-containing protein [Rhizobium sp. LjRoot30]|uniref:putative bifunctional diguanylate cyclase/phosphodiesterase n=1 Tax=Rhizobium sp. LjRoot30 TaxID=3342320 RepID=UPI003ECC3E56